MQSIELTEEHKSKLLEMCKTLFPEYKTIDLFFIENDLFVGNLNGEDIHWFEFCVGYLFAKLLEEKKNSRYYRETLEDFGIKAHNSLIGITPYHPIDFIYEEFDRLHLNPVQMCACEKYTEAYCLEKCPE